MSLHIRCLLGEYEIYMMPGRVVNFDGTNFSILPNNHFTRRICTRCHNRCQQKIALKKSEREILCSLHCVSYSIYNL